MPENAVQIVPADPTEPRVRGLLDEHLAEMYATSPPESVHALDPQALRHPDIVFFVALDGDSVVGCGALKRLDDSEAELKSMRTAESARGRGVGSRMLGHLLGEARARGYRVVRLETGCQEYFAPARRLYARHGFAETGPFAGYVLDANSVYMRLELEG